MARRFGDYVEGPARLVPAELRPTAVMRPLARQGIYGIAELQPQSAHTAHPHTQLIGRGAKPNLIRSRIPSWRFLGCGSVVVVQHASQPLSLLHRANGHDLLWKWTDDPVLQALMVALSMVMDHEFQDCLPQ